MEVQQMFQKLNNKLDQLQQRKVIEDIDGEELTDELENLKSESERIVEEWLKFEDKLGRFLDELEGETGDASTQSKTAPQTPQMQQVKEYEQMYQQLFTSPAGSQATCESEAWRKGKALYDLLMFEHAIPYLEKTTKEHPDFEQAKLYLSHAYLATNHIEQAKYHLQFLFETTLCEELHDLALHTLGCIEGERGEFERSLHYFEKIHFQRLNPEWKLIFVHNYIQTLYQLKKYDECFEQLMQTYQQFPDDWKTAYLLGKVAMDKNDSELGLSFWFEALQLREHPTLLKEMAKYFESNAHHQMAAQCYYRLLQDRTTSEDADAWYGLSWNYGLANQEEKSKEAFMKALTLFPDHLGLQISYTWMLIYWKEHAKARRNIVQLREKNPEHPLVNGLVYIHEGKLGEAMEHIADGVQQE